MKFILMFAILLLPFQLLGLATFYILVKSNLRRARTAGVLVPAVSFFVTFLALFLWSYFHPGMLILANGAFNLTLLIVLIAGTALNLIAAVIVNLIFYRSNGYGKA